MNTCEGVRVKHPAHPGSFVRFEVIEPLGLSVTDAARVLGVARAALSSLLNERSVLSPEMALRVEQAFGISMETLLRMQLSVDIAQARDRLGDLGVKRYPKEVQPA